ncbi:MAG: hypothetical protein ACYCZX_12695 [Rhodospirillaceae bacterium]
MNPRTWALLAGLLIAAQLGLMLHQSQHHMRPDVVASDDCVLCQVAASMATGPAAPLLVIPVFILLAIVPVQPVTAPRFARVTSSFRSRAPPTAP